MESITTDDEIMGGKVAKDEPIIRGPCTRRCRWPAVVLAVRSQIKEQERIQKTAKRATTFNRFCLR
jgi:hypothetical protein